MTQEHILSILSSDPERWFTVRELAQLCGTSYGATSTAALQMIKYREIEGVLVEERTRRSRFMQWRYRLKVGENR